MPRSKKNERSFLVNDVIKKRKRGEEMPNKGDSTSLNYRDIKDWYYGDKFKSIRKFNYSQDMTECDSLNKVVLERANEDDQSVLIGQESQRVEKHKEADIPTDLLQMKESLILSKLNNKVDMKDNLILSKLNNKVDLFKNPGVPEKLVLKKTSKNIRLGYKKIIRQDLLYNELYQDSNFEGNFKCCKEYKKYVNYLLESHNEGDCGDVHKGRLEYLCEVACYELYNKSTNDFECPIKTTCPLKFCRDTFCSQCNLCVTNSDETNCFPFEKQAK